MSLFDVLQRPEENQKNGIKGVAVAVVTNNVDPDKKGRIKVKYPWRDSEDESYWARFITFMAGNEMGGFFLPEVNDEVLVAFENGEIDTPYILGSLWSGKIKPPETNEDGKNNIRKIKSRSGHEIILNDKAGEEKVELKTKSGHKIVMDDTSGSEKIEILDKTGSNTIFFDSSQNSISIKSSMKLSIESNQIEIKAGSMMNIEASGNLVIKGAMVMIN